jgi:hypothetical protein
MITGDNTNTHATIRFKNSCIIVNKHQSWRQGSPFRSWNIGLAPMDHRLLEKVISNHASTGRVRLLCCISHFISCLPYLPKPYRKSWFLEIISLSQKSKSHSKFLRFSWRLFFLWLPSKQTWKLASEQSMLDTFLLSTKHTRISREDLVMD